MTDEMVWALRKRHDKGATVAEMAKTYGIQRRVVAAVVGERDRRDDTYWPVKSLWRIREMLREGRGYDEIADEFGVTRRTVTNVVNNNQDMFRAFDAR